MASSEKLSEIVSVRFTPAEITQLRAIAGDRPLSHVVRELAVAGPRRSDSSFGRKFVRAGTSAGNRLLSVMTPSGVTGRQQVHRRPFTQPSVS